MKTLYLAWQDPEDRRWLPVGRLSFDGHVYCFVYPKGAKQSPRFVPFGMMRNLHGVYESAVLFHSLQIVCCQKHDQNMRFSRLARCAGARG